MRRYRELLRIPGVTPLLLAAGAARLPYGMFVLALILLLRAEGFDYADVGIVIAASGLSVGVSAPVLGRVIDRVGQTPVLVATAVMTLVTGGALTVAVLSGAGVALAAVLAFAGGLCVPPVGPTLRTLLPGLVGRERLDTAFALDALQVELSFMLGPLLAAALAAAISPQFGYVTGIVLQAAGALTVAANPASRRWRPEPHEPGSRRAGALSLPALRILLVPLTLSAVSLGVLEIGIAAFAERHGTRDDSGWLFALWGAGSLTGGLWYGAREWNAPTHVRFLAVSGVMAVCLTPLPFAGSLPVFAACVVLAGLALAPSTTAIYSLVSELAPPTATTEAYAWVIVCFVAGSAAGAWLAGVVVESVSVAAALACAPLSGALALLVALAARNAITAPAPPSPRSGAPR
jgi:predicted MFS family arabinose efflux permease